MFVKLENLMVKLHDCGVTLTSEFWQTQKHNTIRYVSWADFASHFQKKKKKRANEDKETLILKAQKIKDMLQGFKG